MSEEAKVIPPGALAHLRSKGGVAKLLASKVVKKQASKASRTDRFSLQEKRMEYAKLQQLLDYNVKLLLSGAVEKEDEQARLLNYTNIIGIQIMTGQMGLMVDALTEVSKCQIKQPDGSLKPGKRRISIAETMSDVHDMHVDLLTLTDMLTSITHEMGKAQNLWLDEKTGVQRSPYEDRPEDVERRKTESPTGPDVVSEDEDALADGEEPVDVDDLRRVSDEFVKKGKADLGENQ